MTDIWNLATIAWRALGRRDDIEAMAARAKPFYAPVVAAGRALQAAQQRDPKFFADATALYEEIMGAPLPGTATAAPTVQWIQQSLDMLGAHVTADGIMGPATHNATMAYQQAKGLVVDGWVGPDTYAAIVADLKAKGKR